MAVEAEDAAEQFLAEAIHHAHDDDEGGDAKGDAHEREDGDDRDEALALAGAEIAEGDHPFEGVEHQRRGRNRRSRA